MNVLLSLRETIYLLTWMPCKNALAIGLSYGGLVCILADPKHFIQTPHYGLPSPFSSCKGSLVMLRHIKSTLTVT